jgi:flagellum-specific peptidoglycan hydrolase FlgJ
MNPLSLIANAEKLSVTQLQQSIKNGTIPAYIGIPMMQEKIKQAKQAQTPAAPQEPPIAQQVMAEAAGIDQVPSNLPVATAKDGGIVAFADGGDVEDFDQEAYEDQQDEAEYAQAIEDSLNAAEQGGSSSKVSSPKVANVNHTPSVEGGIKAPAGDFYKNMYSTLKAKAEEMGFKNPEAIARVGAAQSALETGYGKHLAGGNNYFGIKGSGGNKQSTKEYSPERGYYNANESFRTYGNMGDSAADYLRLMQNPRYAKVAAAETPEEAIAHQSRSGYATSPQYGSSLRAIHSANMAEGGIARLNVPRFNKDGYVQDDSLSTTGLSQYNRFLKKDKDTAAKVYGSAVPEQPASDLLFDNTDTRSVKDRRLDAANETTPTYDALGNVTGITELPRTKSDAVSNPQVNSLNYEYGTGSAPPSVNLSADNTELDRLTRRYPAPAQGIAIPKVETSSTETPASSPASTSAPSGAKQKSEYDLIREDIMNQREELKRQKQEDKYMAILQAGLGMMGGTSPNAFANIGQGASMGIAQYGQSAKQRAAENAALNKGLLSAQRYQSMDEYQRAALASREGYQKSMIDERGEDRRSREEIKAEELARNRERDIGTLINNGSARATAELKAKFPNPDLLSDKDKIAYKQEEANLYTKYVAPFITVQNQMLQKRYPEYFINDASVRPAPTGGNRIRVDAKGNVIN